LSELLRFGTDEGTFVVEVADDDPGFELVTRDGVIADTRQRLEDALVGVRRAAQSALRVFQDESIRPDGVELEFGVKLNAEAGAVIAKTAVEGHFQVKLSWQRTPDRVLPDAG
jgi:hypothetical protein